MTAIANNAFRGLENTLQNVNLAGNELRSVPVQPLRQLRMVSLLDLSRNKIKFVPENAFVTLRLKTLKLSDNNLTLSEHALRGLETSLKNLNLKGCQLKAVPEAVQKMTGLAFLDLAQNNIRTVPPGVFKALDSLTALNLERNIIQSLDGGVFEGVSDTLSSVSLLNNLLTDFPVEAVMTLKELRVSASFI
jgi:Leucine-rich repeat (LRR) protein